jgi:hypothetical protein
MFQTGLTELSKSKNGLGSDADWFITNAKLLALSNLKPTLLKRCEMKVLLKNVTPVG